MDVDGKEFLSVAGLPTSNEGLAGGVPGRVGRVDATGIQASELTERLGITRD